MSAGIHQTHSGALCRALPAVRGDVHPAVLFLLLIVGKVQRQQNLQRKCGHSVVRQSLAKVEGSPLSGPNLEGAAAPHHQWNSCINTTSISDSLCSVPCAGSRAIKALYRHLQYIRSSSGFLLSDRSDYSSATPTRCASRPPVGGIRARQRGGCPRWKTKSTSSA